MLKLALQRHLACRVLTLCYKAQNIIDYLILINSDVKIIIIRRETHILTKALQFLT